MYRDVWDRNKGLYGTPSERLQWWLSNHGSENARIVPSDSPDLGMEVDAWDLGNGLHVCKDTEDYGDYVHAFSDSGELNYGDIPKGFVNLSAQYTGQYGSPDCMHDSEFVGGGLAEEVARTLGLWRFPIVNWDCSEDCASCEELGCYDKESDCQCDGVEGWLVLYSEHPEDD